MPAHVADDVARPRVDQQLVRVEAISLARVVGAVHADAVQRADARELALDEAVMDRAGLLRQREPRGLVPAGGVVETDVDARGGARLDREIDALARERRA